MPRQPGPPQLRIRPDTGYWTIYYREDKRPRELTTGIRAESGGAAAAAEAFFATWLQNRARPQGGPRDPAQVMVGECLLHYGATHAKTVSDPEREGHAIAALLPYWRYVPVAHVNNQTSTGYVGYRLDAIAQRRADLHRAAVARRAARIAAGERPGPVPKPPAAPSTATPSRELDTLNAAVGYCADEGMLTYRRVAKKPAKTPAKERWLTRADVTKALREARRSRKSRHLADFIRLAVYVGRRKEAILTLRWTQNTDGGWVDLERGIVDFDPVGRPETKKRRGKVRLPPRVLCWLRAKYRNRRSDYVIERRVMRRRDGRLVPTVEHMQDVRQGIERLFARTGAGHVTPHVFRHTCATWLMQGGRLRYEVDIEECADYLKMSVNTLRNVYGHHHPDYQRVAVEAMS